MLAKNRTSVVWYKDNENLGSYIGEWIMVETLAATTQGLEKYISTLVIRAVDFQDEG